MEEFGVSGLDPMTVENVEDLFLQSVTYEILAIHGILHGARFRVAELNSAEKGAKSSGGFVVVAIVGVRGFRAIPIWDVLRLGHVVDCNGLVQKPGSVCRSTISPSLTHFTGFGIVSGLRIKLCISNTVRVQNPVGALIRQAKVVDSDQTQGV